ncbi:MAG: GNAT family N-acetyltransferase [Terriglobales bacterium]
MSWNLHRSPDLGPLAEVWTAAQAAAPHHVFQHFSFARHWAACFAAETDFCIAWQPAPPVLLPLARRHGCWSLIGEGLFDYLDVIGAADPRWAQAAADWVQAHLGAPVCISGVAAATAWAPFWRACGMAPLPFASVPWRDAGRHELAREHRRVERRWQAAAVTLRPSHGERERRRVLEWLLEHKQRNLSAQGRANVLGEKEYRWLAAMVAHQPALAELWELRRGTRPLAALLCWISPTTRYAYTISYDAAAAALSPGVLALYALLRHTMREGREFNFLTGEQAFKQRFATRTEQLLRYQTAYGEPQP